MLTEQPSDNRFATQNDSVAKPKLKPADTLPMPEISHMHPFPVVGRESAKAESPKNMYITKWIEGEDNLNAFCMKRFKETPRFVETTGHVGAGAKVRLIYKWRDDKQRYVPMYLLYMQHPNGTVGDFSLSDIEHQNYEQIRTDRTSLLVP